MGRTALLIAGVFALVMAAPATAQEFKPPLNLFGQKAPAPKPPKIDWNWRPSPQETRTAKPAVICGMTLVPADPNVDPKMRVERPEGDVAFTMRVVPPTVCKAP